MQGRQNFLSLVGGLSQSRVIKEYIKKTYPHLEIFHPHESDLAVVRGAVQFGLDPNIVTARVSRYTYGIAVFEDFNEEKHDGDKKERRGKKYVCKDVFSRKLTRGESVTIGKSVIKINVYETFDTPERKDKQKDPLTVTIYKSKEKEVKYTTDEGCNELCKLKIDAPKDGWPENVMGYVKLEVSKTELIATFSSENATDEKTCRFEFM